jgi:hypothetical protein
MIGHEIKIHDKKQFEIKLHYALNGKKRKGEYFVETYFFVPHTLGINHHSFHKKNFYDSVKNYIRLATPEFTLAELIHSENSPLRKLFQLLEEGKGLNEEDLGQEFEHRLKLFCATMAGTVGKEATAIYQQKKGEGFRKDIIRFFNYVEELLESYRRVEAQLFERKDEKLIFSFGDEYLSLLVEKHLLRILNFYEKNFEKNIQIREIILDFLKKEIKRREERGYRSIVREDSSNEEMLFRFSALKKYFSSVLSLDADVEREGTILEHVLFGIAAGIAMIFATAAAFWGKSAFGTYTMPFFILLVISYMFKDRIKELMREILKKSVFKYLFDYKYKLYVEEKHKVGIIRESFDFVQQRQLLKNVWKLRQVGKTPEFDNKFQKEKIILYRKKINLKSRFFKKHNEEGFYGLSDIFRFDVTRFLSKMDDPSKPLFALTKDGYKLIYGKRVYHVNLILRIVRNKSNEELKRFRLILTREGIDRIEPVLENN